MCDNAAMKGAHIHRSTTENFCWDEIRPRDWLDVDVGIFGHAPSIIVSTTLFLMFINDLEDGVQSTVLKFADDTKLYTEVTKEVNSCKKI